MMSMKYALTAIVMGACISVYLPMLSQSARIAGSPVLVNIVFYIPRIGAGPFFILLVAGQMLMGTIISQFGLLGSPVDPLTVRKVVGVALAIGGAYLVTFSH